MTLAIINGPAVVEFIEDRNAFEIYAKENFKMLDINEDGVISKEEFCDGFCKIMALECELKSKQEINDLREAIFERFDEDKNGVIDNREFNCLMKEIMLAMARGFGNSLVLLALHARSLTLKVVEHGNGSITNNKC